MSPSRRTAAMLGLTAAATAAVLLSALPGSATPTAPAAAATTGPTYVYRIIGGAAKADALLTAGFDVLGSRGG